jgi:thiamine biosynthesis lipoprotein
MYLSNGLWADALGFLHYMVEIGGEVRTRGERPDGTPWRIARESPQVGAREVLRVVPLSDRAVASSGDYRNFFEFEGRRFSHTIDPRTGWPVEHGLGAASVVAEDCMSADAWATALMVLGPERGREAAEREGLAANLVLRDGDGFRELMTPAYQAVAGD